MARTVTVRGDTPAERKGEEQGEEGHAGAARKGRAGLLAPDVLKCRSAEVLSAGVLGAVVLGARVLGC